MGVLGLADMNTSVFWGVALLVPLAWGQQMCLTMTRPRASLESNSPIVFDKISTSGTSTFEESLVDVSLANTTGEVKIKPIIERVCDYGNVAHPGVARPGLEDSRICSGGGQQFFYLSVKASRHSRDPSSCPRSAQLFLLVNGKVPLRGLVTQYKMYGGGIEMERAHRVVGLATDKVLDDNMPLGVLNVGDTEATFEAMDYIKHEDSLRVMTGDLDNAIGYVSVCIFWHGQGNFGNQYGK